MGSSSRTSARLWAVAAGIVVGAGVAFAYVGTGGPSAASPRQSAQREATGTTAPASPRPSPRPKPRPVLPFNAKLTMPSIPKPTGGVRAGGCSGALIAPEWIATAGHCFHDIHENRVGGPPPYAVTVIIGRLKDSDPGGHIAKIVDVRQSPVNDLALARLSAPVQNITPLTVAAAPPPVGEHLYFAGWGSLSATPGKPSDHLKRGRFTVVTIHDDTLEAESLMPKTVENTPCPEDSGSPFFTSGDNRTGRLVAVVDTGPPCPNPGHEVVARVDVVASWIRQQTGIG